MIRNVTLDKWLLVYSEDKQHIHVTKQCQVVVAVAVVGIVGLLGLYGLYGL